MRIIFTNKIYEFQFDKTGVRIKNMETDARTKRFAPEAISFIRSILLLRAEGKAYNCFRYEYGNIFGNEEIKRDSAYVNLRRLSKHLGESISLHGFIVTRLAGFFLNEHIRVIIEKGRTR